MYLIQNSERVLQLRVLTSIIMFAVMQILLYYCDVPYLKSMAQ